VGSRRRLLLFHLSISITPSHSPVLLLLPIVLLLLLLLRRHEILYPLLRLLVRIIPAVRVSGHVSQLQCGFRTAFLD
jgi:hypothetical protein